MVLYDHGKHGHLRVEAKAWRICNGSSNRQAVLVRAGSPSPRWCRRPAGPGLRVDRLFQSRGRIVGDIVSPVVAEKDWEVPARETAPRHSHLDLEPARPRQALAEGARGAESPDNELWLSPISSWELLILIEKGRVQSTKTRSPGGRGLEGHHLREARSPRSGDREPVERPAASGSGRSLPGGHGPVRLTLVTADERLLDSRASRLVNR